MESPEDICGYSPELPDDWAGDTPMSGVHFTGEYCCARPTHEDSNRCIWHSRENRKRLTTQSLDTDDRGATYTRRGGHRRSRSATTSHGKLTPERIDDAYLVHAVMMGIELNFYYFYNSDIVNARVDNVVIEMTKFDRCSIESTRFDDCTLGAEFQWTSLSLTEFKETEFVGVHAEETPLIGARFYDCDFKTSTFDRPEFSREVLFSGCSIDHGTDFTDIQIQKEGAERHEALAKIYGQLADLCISNRELGKYIQYKKRERYAEGRRQLHEARDATTMRDGGLESLVNYLFHEYSRVTMGYGYSVGRVLCCMVFLLVASAVLYAGLTCTSPANGLTIAERPCSTSNGALLTLLESLYFSAVTLATLGYGDINPVGLSRLVATVESLGGLILSAQFVYALATKTSL